VEPVTLRELVAGNLRRLRAEGGAQPDDAAEDRLAAMQAEVEAIGTGPAAETSTAGAD
jgi:hypothetical protein